MRGRIGLISCNIRHRPMYASDITLYLTLCNSVLSFGARLDRAIMLVLWYCKSFVMIFIMSVLFSAPCIY